MPQVSRVGDVDSDGDVLTIGSPTVFAGNSAFTPEFETAPVTIPQVYDIEFVRANLSTTGKYAEFDEPETIAQTPKTYPEDTPPVSYDGGVKEQVNVASPAPSQPVTSEPTSPPPSNNTSAPIAQGDFKPVTLPLNYNLRISDNYTLANLSTRALFAHQIRPQVGLKEQDIVWNLEALAKNILEPIREKWGPFRINSGFRVGSGKSQHNRGQACDIQEPSWGNKKLFEVAKWVAANLPFDQCLLEHGNSCWLHVSFDRTKKKQRGQVMTMIRGKFEPGLKLYYS